MFVVAGCGQSMQPGRTHHRLYAWNCPSSPDGRAYLVLRYQDEWTDAGKSSRVGLIKFRTDPQPQIFDDQYIWGVPTGSEHFILFDATRNRILRRTGYVRQLDVGGSDLLAFADKRQAVEVVRADGRVLVPAQAGFTDVKLAYELPDGTPVLACTRAAGGWELRDAAGRTVGGGPAMTTLGLDGIAGSGE